MEREIWKAKPKCKCGNLCENIEVNIEGFKVRGWRCKKCGEEYLHPEDAQKVLVFSKLKKGIKVKVGELGKAKIVRLPQEFAEYYHIKKGELIEMKAETKNRFTLEPHS